MIIWFIGGIFALCGATAYAEVATTFPQSGGEYTFLSKIYHPIVGFASGWVSIVVGFSVILAHFMGAIQVPGYVPTVLIVLAMGGVNFVGIFN